MEANFIGEVPDYLKCVVCHHVFKDPVMIIECGHRLCNNCFQDICDHSKQNNLPLLCPIDRKEVEVDKVIDDKGIHRAVMDLKVRCDQCDQGCTWSGDLGRLEEHTEKGCSVTSLKKFMDRVESSLKEKEDAIKQLEQRISFHDAQDVLKDTQMNKFREQLTSLEGKLYQKDEELCLLKYHVSLLQAGCSALSQETSAKGEDSLSASGIDLTKLRGRNTAGFVADEKDVSESEWRKVIEEKDKKISHLEYQLARVTNDLFQSRELLQHQKAIPNCTNTADINNNSKNNNNRNNINMSLENISTSSNDNYVKDANNETTVLLSLPDNQGKKRKIDSEQAGSSKATCQSVNYSSDLLRLDVMNVAEYIPGDRTVFKWIITDFTRHEIAGERVESPKFYCSIPGYCCRLSIQWKRDKRNLCVFLSVCEGLYGERMSEVFCKTVTFKRTDRSGKVKQLTINKEEFKKYFQKNPSSGYGHSSPFSPAEYLINDTLTITCVISHK